MLAASGMEPAVLGGHRGGQGVCRYPQASILGFGGRVPATMAALANGALAHCLDYDDQTPWGAARGELDHSSGVCLGRT
ncbi:hypothetical protein ACFS4T_19670 [Pseudomonas lini]